MELFPRKLPQQVADTQQGPTENIVTLYPMHKERDADQLIGEPEITTSQANEDTMSGEDAQESTSVNQSWDMQPITTDEPHRQRKFGDNVELF